MHGWTVPQAAAAPPLQHDRFVPMRSQSALEPDQHRWVLFSRNISSFTGTFAALWDSAPSVSPRLGRAISIAEKLEREQWATRGMAEIRSRLRQLPRSTKSRQAEIKFLLNLARELASGCLGLPEAGLNLFFTRTAFQATRQFVHEARSFDPDIGDQSLFQALRNLWVTHCIQVLLEEPISLLPATFGYSMLYPWTDNYLDDPKIAEKPKASFCNWLEQRLQGRGARRKGGRTAQVSRLIGLIEKTYPRNDFEQVYFSLRAIHEAQVASLQQQRDWAVLEGRDLLYTTLRKGGTSVLADAWLVKGRLDEVQAQFMFGYGAVLQLMDDLQDIQSDLANRHATLFARQTFEGALDCLTSKLWSFAEGLLRSPVLAAQTMQPLRTLIRECWKLVLLECIARNPQFYSVEFAAEMESSSPFCFAFMRDRESSFVHDCDNLRRLVSRRWDIDPALDFIPEPSGLPRHRVRTRTTSAGA